MVIQQHWVGKWCPTFHKSSKRAKRAHHFFCALDFQSCTYTIEMLSGLTLQGTAAKTCMVATVLKCWLPGCLTAANRLDLSRYGHRTSRHDMACRLFDESQSFLSLVRSFLRFCVYSALFFSSSVVFCGFCDDLSVSGVDFLPTYF